MEIIGEYVTLKRKGVNYTACCPFHNEKTPSFVVSPSKGLYKCFGCGKGGNAVTFIMEHENVSYPEALKMVAKRYGIEVQEKELTEEEIRRNLIENNNIDAIIGLPANIFFGTGIPTIVMVLRQKRDRDDVLFVDASKGFIKVGKNNQLRARDIRKIVDAVTERREMPKFSRCVDREEIRKNDYTSISLATSIRQKLMSSGIFTPRCLAAYLTTSLTVSQIGGIYSPRCEMNCSARLMRLTVN